MKFKRYDRYEPVNLSERKAALFLRKQERERQKYPLFQDQIAVASLEAEASRRIQAQHATEQRMRAFHARVWHEARRDYFAATQDQRRAVLAMWNIWPGPKTSTYFRYVVDECTGVMAARDQAFRAQERDRRIERRAIAASQQTIDLAG